MGLLTVESGNDDYQAVELVATQSALVWNKYIAPISGHGVTVGEAQIRKLCDTGHKILSNPCFPKNPGPFKRIAAYLILGRLHPLIGVVPYQAAHTKGIAIDRADDEKWLVRYLTLNIPILFYLLDYDSGGGVYRPLGKFKGFPTPHYRLEFMAWLRWLEGGDGLDEAFNYKRFARMVMSTSLMLEASFYATHNGNMPLDIGTCLDELTPDNEIDLAFDNGVPARYSLTPPSAIAPSLRSEQSIPVYPSSI